MIYNPTFKKKTAIMKSRKLFMLLVSVLALGICRIAVSQETTTSEAKTLEPKKAEQLRGSVRRVRVETAKMSIKDGKLVEGTREIREVSTYDIRGNRVDKVSMPDNPSEPQGQRQYRYDDRGNVTESSIRNETGALVLKEHYEYQFDELGNWIKMTTSIDVYEGGKLSFEPTEVVYRTITYFYDQRVANIAGDNQASPSPKPQSNPASKAASLTSGTSSQPGPVASVSPVPARGGMSTTSAPAKESPSPHTTGESTPANTQPSANEGPAETPSPIKKVSAKRISESELRAAAVDIPNAEFPVVAELSGRNRKVEVQVVVDENGDVTSARGTSAEEILNIAAEDAAKKAKFAPAKLAPVPTQVFSVISYDFISLPPSRVPPVTPTTHSTGEVSVGNNEVKDDSLARTPATSPATPSVAPSANAMSVEKYQLGLSMLNEGRFAEAEDALKEFVYRNPDDVSGYSKLAIAYIAQKKNEEAAITLKVAIRIKPTGEPQNYYLLGTCYNALGKYAQAMDTLKRAIDFSVAPTSGSPSDNVVSLSAVHYALGISYHGLGRSRDAIQEFNKSLSIDPRNADAHYALGMIQLSVGDRRAAEKQANILKSLNVALAKRLSDMITGQSVLIPSRCTVFPC